MYHKFDLFGWHDGTSETQTDRSTDVAPEMPVPAARVDGEVYPNFTGYKWVNLVFPGTTVPVDQPEEGVGA